MAENKTRLGIGAWAIAVFVVALGASGVRNLLSPPAALVLSGLLVLLSLGVFLRIRPERFRWYRLPSPLYWFLGWAALSLIWSASRLETLEGVIVQLAAASVGVALAFVLSWHELLRTLGTALRYLLGLSLVFELFLAVVVRQPVAPWWVDPADVASGAAPGWSGALLGSGGPIQGLPGDTAQLGFLALLALIVWGIQLRATLVRSGPGWFWVCVAVLTLLLTRSATVWLALGAVLLALGLAVWARRRGPERRAPLYVAAALAVAAATALTVWAREFVFGILGRADELASATAAWDRDWALVQQRPVVGWGWAGSEPGAGSTSAGAQSAWLDVWLQLGVIGVLVFAPLVVLTLWRVWCRAVDPPRRGPGPALPYATSALWPWLVMVALIVQSLTESRLLADGAWLLLVVLATKTRFDFVLPAPDTEPTARPWRDVPIPRA